MKTAMINHRGVKLGSLGQIPKEFPWGTMEVIVLGESGRGRTQTIVPCVLALDGGAKLGLSRTNQSKVVPGENTDGWLLRISSEGIYTRNTLGCVYAKQTPVAVGMGAYGDAGRIGEWYDYLIQVPDQTWIRLRPSGGENKIPRKWIYCDEQQVFLLNDKEALIFIEAHDWVSPLPYNTESCPKSNTTIDLGTFSSYKTVEEIPPCSECGEKYYRVLQNEDPRVPSGFVATCVHDGWVTRLSLERR